MKLIPKLQTAMILHLLRLAQPLQQAQEQPLMQALQQLRDMLLRRSL